MQTLPRPIKACKTCRWLTAHFCLGSMNFWQLSKQTHTLVYKPYILHTFEKKGQKKNQNRLTCILNPIIQQILRRKKIDR